MGWHITGQLIEACSCKAICPCVLGPAQPDQGWCSGALTFVVQHGESDGVELRGRKVVFLVDLPRDFASGNGTARLYVDDGADGRQRQELESIFTGKKGGPGVVLGSLVAKWLPTQTAAIAVHEGESPSVTIGTVGNVKLERIKDEAGHATKLLNAPALGAIQVDTMDLARSDGSRFADPQMRRWEGGGHGSLSPFTWKV